MAQRFTIAIPGPGGQDINVGQSSPAGIVGLPVSAIVAPSTASTVASIPDSASSVPLLAANVARKGAVVTNTSSAVLYVRLGSGPASQTMFTYRLAQNDTQDINFGYVGVINGMWATDPDDGAAVVTELF